jgi:hypothetical protein
MRLLASALRLARHEGWSPYRGLHWQGWQQPVGGWAVSRRGKTLRIGVRVSDATERLVAEVRVAHIAQALDVLAAYGLLPLSMASAFDAALDPDYAARCEAGRAGLEVAVTA